MEGSASSLLLKPLPSALFPQKFVNSKHYKSQKYFEFSTGKAHGLVCRNVVDVKVFIARKIKLVYFLQVPCCCIYVLCYATYEFLLLFSTNSMYNVKSV